ncbi:hypothetical protein [Rufibacter hautae]|uniref:DUF4149 domain-containing protein n=1 Tax=Rufibacter hautae TaxID=2595005 RepID=A0A5B6TA69_9BACT|nr:hypothetical protein [Rufibacter hautae]KAA3436835.1 hypothetical protein FOA19_20895 [Rufibacter hautae]
MRSHPLTFVTIAALLLWAGMVVGISFIEAPVKFTAPGITLALGLGIGRLVFGVMNKVELVLCTVALLGLFFNHGTRKEWTLLGLLTGILLLQTFWLLPVLDVRTLAVIAGNTAPGSNLHYLYIGLEVLKLGLLVTSAAIVHNTTIKAKNSGLLFE